MKHLQAIELLSRHSELDSDQRRELDAHAAVCRECRGWLATWDLLSDPGIAADNCLDSNELCAFALGSEDLKEAANERCRRHLEGCAECAYEVDLVRNAVQEPLDAPPPFIGLSDKKQHATLSKAWLAVAATLTLVIGGLVMVNQLLEPQSEDYRMVGESVAGSRSIVTNSSILVEATKLERGSALELASASVALGNGFSVQSGATLRVETSNEPSG